MFYAGDGVSDLSAAKETDLLFAKRGKDLVTYCDRQDIPFTLFDDWSNISQVVKQIVYDPDVLLGVRMLRTKLTLLPVPDRRPSRTPRSRATGCTSRACPHDGRSKNLRTRQ